MRCAAVALVLTLLLPSALATGGRSGGPAAGPLDLFGGDPGTRAWSSPVLIVEAYIRALRDRTRPRNFDRHARDTTDLIFRHDRAARKTPDTAVDHTNAKPRGLPVRIRWDTATSPAAAPATTTSAATTAPTAAATAASAFTRSIEAGRSAWNVRRHREANIRVAARGQFRFAEDDVGKAFEFRLQDATPRRVRQQLRNEIARVKRGGRGGAHTFDENTT